MCELNPGPKMYDLLLRDKTRRAGLEQPEDLVAKWDRMCWNCQKCHREGEEDRLKTCTGCKWAR